MVVTLSGSGPLYQQVYRALREAILSGRLRAGDRLPVSRLLARDLAVSRNIVLIAYEQLISEGYAVGRVGAGTFVAAMVPDSMFRIPTNGQPESLQKPVAAKLSQYGLRLLTAPGSDAPIDASGPRLRYDFAYYLASAQDFPGDLWRRLLTRRLRTLELDYSPVQGDAGLRAEIASYLRRSRAVDCQPEQILLVNGSQQAIDLIARILLNPGDAVVIEDPHYQGAREIFRSIGARIIPIPVDRSGLQVARLPQAGRVRLAYVTPSHQFPTGAILPLDRRLALLSWAEKNKAYILEDDYDGEYRYEGRPVEAVQALDRTGRVIYAGTFSRILFPSLRMGYVVMPAALAPTLSRAKWIADRHTSFLQQAALADFMREGYLDRSVRRARVRNAARRQVLLAAIEKHFGDAVEVLGAAAGVHVLLHLPGIAANQTSRLIARAAASGVGIYSAAPYYLKPPNRCELVLGYGAMTERDIATGIRLLAGGAREIR
jgi:GntR family transcriptional regulator / MocR family aminotransferase